ncbi:restriction endonuclease subunit S [Shewanella sp. YIC-542]|uniref:restriction endonuclease subunit S n=1 Tax=Shewanella mytili TaxID=3377111 RepID=UPI00398F697D
MSERIPEGWVIDKVGNYICEYSKKCVVDGEYEVLTSSKSGLIRQTDYYGENRITRKCTIGFNIVPHKFITYRSRSDNNRFTFNKNNLGIIGLVSKYYPVFTHKCGDTYNQFLTYLVNFHSDKFALESVGTSQLVLSLSAVKSVKLMFPSLPEQQEIAKILTSVDDVIEKTQAQIDKLKDLKTGMMQELLTKGVGVDGKPHTEFKDSPVGRIPKDWVACSMGSVSNLITKGATPTTSGHSYASEGIRFYRSVNASEDGTLILDDVRYISSDADEQLKRSSLQRGDVVLSIVGAKTGKTFFLIDDLSPLPANINQNIALVRVNKGRVLPEYLKYFISSAAFQLQVDREITTQAQPSLSLKQVGDFILPVPHLSEQIEIVESLNSLSNVLAVKLTKLTHFQSLKKALMQDLLTGKVRVTID